MQFIEMSGAVLMDLVTSDEVKADELREAGVQEDSLVRVNHQGDIELRRRDRWDVIGGLLGDFEDRVKVATGLDWA